MNVNEYLSKIGHPDPDALYPVLPSVSAARAWKRHPILFRLPADWIEALKNIEIHLAPTEYQQPFPNIMVVFPDGECVLASVLEFPAGRGLKLMYSYGVRPQTGGRAPSTLGFEMRLDKPGTMLDGTQVEEIEEVVRSSENLSKREADRVEFLARIVINACLLLSNHPLYRKHTEREQELIRIRKKGRREQKIEAEKKLKLMPQVIDFRVQPQVYNSYGTDTGTTKCPHWRKGYHRMQAYGPAWSLRRRIFVRPVLIHSDWLDGDDGNTVVYRGKGPGPDFPGAAGYAPEGVKPHIPYSEQPPDVWPAPPQ